jgi:hypothetical protein
MTPLLVDLVLTNPNQPRNKGLFPPFGIAQMAGQMPEKLIDRPLNISFWDMLCDGAYDPSNRCPDIIWISSLTPGIDEGYQIALNAQKFLSHAGKPIKVIIGGIHVTALPEEALSFCNIVVRGEVTAEFQEFLLKRLMDMDSGDREVWRLATPPATIRRPPARWDIINSAKYRIHSGLITEVGCGMNCPFCSATNIFGPKLRLVAEDCLKADIAALPAGLVGLYNDNFLLKPDVEHIKRSMLVANLLWKYGRHQWGSEVTLRTLKSAIEVARKELGISLLDYYYDRGCRMMLFGIETVGSRFLKKSLSDDDSATIIRETSAHGILPIGSFVLGVDPEETRDKPKQILEFAIDKAELGGLFVSIKMPLPGSDEFLTAVKDGTLLHRGWGHYKAEYATIKHPNLSPGELEQGRSEIIAGMCSTKSIIQRIFQPVFTGRKPISSLPLLIGANAAAVYAAKSYVIPDYQRLKEKPIVEVPLRPEVLSAVDRAWAKHPSTPKLFNVNQPKDGISNLY